ncbi:MAG: GHKL domain-containing protein [Clostridia bacterium]|nr:GHKL domain-containing protein [Clostridia bacterium]
MNTIIRALTDSQFWSDILLLVIDEIIGSAVLCVACVLFLSYLRERPPVFEKKSVLIAITVLFSGALPCSIISHYCDRVINTYHLKNVDHLPHEELLSMFNADYLGKVLSPGAGSQGFDMAAKAGADAYSNAAITNLLFKGLDFSGLEYEKHILIYKGLAAVIGFVTICAGAFILMKTFRAKHIVPMASVQITGFLLRRRSERYYIWLIQWILNRIAKPISPKLCGYSGFAYGCFMVIMIILYILVTKYRFESFWTKNINVGTHIMSVIGLFAAYTFLILIYNCILYYLDKNISWIILYIYELMITVFLAAVLLYVPKRTYALTRGELQEDFYEVKREEEVEQYSHSESRIRAERKYMHDLPGHFRELTSMAEKRGADEIAEYVQELDKKLVESKGEFSTGNGYLDDFLYEKLKNAQQHNIDILFNGVFPNKGVKRIDVITIFHNLIENAIDACKNVSGKREITITSKLHEDRVYISISNPFEQKLQKQQGKYETRKKNKAFHGYGLSSVESVVKKKEYDGSFSTTQEGNIFISEVILKFK